MFLSPVYKSYGNFQYNNVLLSSENSTMMPQYKICIVKGFKTFFSLPRRGGDQNQQTKETKKQKNPKKTSTKTPQQQQNTLNNL